MILDNDATRTEPKALYSFTINYNYNILKWHIVKILKIQKQTLTDTFQTN